MAALCLRYWKPAMLWVLSLLTMGVISSSAQPGRERQPGLDLDRITVTPDLVFGNDVGFRIVRIQDGIPIGKVVVRIDGRWVETANDTR